MQYIYSGTLLLDKPNKYFINHHMPFQIFANGKDDGAETAEIVVNNTIIY